jgi:hypothetical protein
MADQGGNVPADCGRGIVRPGGGRLAVTAQIHGDHPVTGGGNTRGEEAVLAAKIAEAGDHHHQRPGADIVIGNAAAGAV